MSTTSYQCFVNYDYSTKSYTCVKEFVPLYPNIDKQFVADYPKNDVRDFVGVARQEKPAFIPHNLDWQWDGTIYRGGSK